MFLISWRVRRGGAISFRVPARARAATASARSAWVSLIQPVTRTESAPASRAARCWASLRSQAAIFLRFGSVAADVCVGCWASRASRVASRLVGGEGCGQPGVEVGQDCVLAQVDGQRVVDQVGDGVFLRVAAAVVSMPVVPGALHPSATLVVDQQAAQGVRVRCPDLGSVGAGASPGAAFLDRVERCLVDDGGVGEPVGPDPLVPLVPLEFGLVAERDVVDVEEGLGFALFVPDLIAGVARVRQDGLHCAFGPGDSGAVSVAGSVVGRRGENAFVGERLGDQEDTHAVEVLPVLRTRRSRTISALCRLRY